jgi:leader peptidase (prepilin peptidase)/N-methyltransferase
MTVYLTAAAAGWGFCSAAVLPRAAHRLAVAAGEPWRDSCAAGHPLPAGPLGSLGATVCPRCPDGGARGAVLFGVLGALLGAALAARLGAHPELAVPLLLLPVALLLARVDLAVRRLPDLLTLPALGGTAVLLGGAALLPGHAGSWRRALLGGAVLLACYGVLFLVSPAGMGLGDVKLAPTLGLLLGWYGWRTLFYGAFAAFALGALTGLALILARRAGRRTLIPFGPFMLAGALCGLLLAAG